MLAEYDRWLAVTSNGERFATHELAIDTCGGYPIDCYLVELNGKRFLRMHDAVSGHLVNLENGTVQIESFDGPSFQLAEYAGTYIGQLDGKVGRLRFTPAAKMSEKTIDR